MEYKVGQTLWFERTLNAAPGTGHDVIVTKVARKWVSLARPNFPHHTVYRVPVDCTYADGGEYSSPGRVWATKEEALAHQELRTEWANLRRDLDRYAHPPKGITKEEIARLRALLKS